MDVQILVFEIERKFYAFALHRGEKGMRDVEVEGISKLVLSGRTARFHARGEVARVVRSETGFPERSEKIAERLEAQKVD
jgi:hypothetical protein